MSKYIDDLKLHQKWRTGEVEEQPLTPKEVTAAIDYAIDFLDGKESGLSKPVSPLDDKVSIMMELNDIQTELIAGIQHILNPRQRVSLDFDATYEIHKLIRKYEEKRNSVVII